MFGQALKLIPDGKGEVVVYEKGSEVGGLWTDPASPIYPDLKTNLPTDLMKFSDLDYPDTVNVKVSAGRLRLAVVSAEVGTTGIF